MSNPREEATDAVTKEEMVGMAAPASPERSKNAFSELMSPKKPKPTHQNGTHTAKVPKLLDTAAQRNLNLTHGRGALIAYTQFPDSFPSSRVISYDKDFVIIHDLYPKSSIHLLLLPRDPVRQAEHPFDALDGSDPAFLSLVQRKMAELRILAAKELRRRYGKFSATERPRLEALEANPDADEESLPKGKDWSRDIISGIHASPSMSHLHIHVLSIDHYSECLRHRKHYNSFATPFLVPVEDFPLAEGDVRRHPGREGYLDEELVCWRCGERFAHKFAKFKAHLEVEFEAWKRE